MLGVSRNAWKAAKAAIGERDAAITLTAIDTGRRSDMIAEAISQGIRGLPPNPVHVR